MAVSQDFLDYCLDQFAEMPELTFKRMFGGAGLYSQGVIFAALSDDRIFLRTDPLNLAAYQAEGAEAFAPMSGSKMPYHELPPQVLENPASALQWGLEAYQASLRNQQPKAKKKGLKVRGPRHS
ncbi:MAG: TfoX/Sxy family protein [bacterium]|nr:TfoX/Sxy family protein [bacterium]